MGGREARGGGRRGGRVCRQDGCATHTAELGRRWAGIAAAGALLSLPLAPPASPFVRKPRTCPPAPPHLLCDIERCRRLHLRHPPLQLRSLSSSLGAPLACNLQLLLCRPLVLARALRRRLCRNAALRGAFCLALCRAQLLLQLGVAVAEAAQGRRQEGWKFVRGAWCGCEPTAINQAINVVDRVSDGRPTHPPPPTCAGLPPAPRTCAAAPRGCASREPHWFSALPPQPDVAVGWWGWCVCVVVGRWGTIQVEYTLSGIGRLTGLNRAGGGASPMMVTSRSRSLHTRWPRPLLPSPAAPLAPGVPCCVPTQRPGGPRGPRSPPAGRPPAPVPQGERG